LDRGGPVLKGSVGQADAVLDVTSKFAPDILGCECNVEHGGMDLGVLHQIHQSGQRDASADHIGAEGVPEPVRRYWAATAEQLRHPWSPDLCFHG
jgi:hypothetical protein